MKFDEDKNKKDDLYPQCKSCRKIHSTKKPGKINQNKRKGKKSLKLKTLLSFISQKILWSLLKKQRTGVKIIVKTWGLFVKCIRVTTEPKINQVFRRKKTDLILNLAHELKTTSFPAFKSQTANKQLKFSIYLEVLILF